MHGYSKTIILFQLIRSDHSQLGVYLFFFSSQFGKKTPQIFGQLAVCLQGYTCVCPYNNEPCTSEHSECIYVCFCIVIDEKDKTKPFSRTNLQMYPFKANKNWNSFTPLPSSNRKKSYLCKKQYYMYVATILI